MADVAIVSWAHSVSASEAERNEIEMLMPVIHDAVGGVGLDTHDLGFVVSGSSDYLQGLPFAFVSALDAVGPWPPVQESHVEMDGAWALYEAWVRLHHGDIDTALVYAFGKPTFGDLDRVLAIQLDPYTMAPLFPDQTGLAALQARTLLDRGSATERDFAAVAARCRGGDVEAYLAAPKVADPLRAHDCPSVADGAVAVVLATGDRARELTDRPVWIRGIDHRIDALHLGQRDLGGSSSARKAAQGAGVADGRVDVAELHARYSHEELVLRGELGLNGANVNRSGGALAADPFMATGLVRIAEAAKALREGEGRRGVAHAASGPCLQQNLVAVLEVA